jgi:hypothetical protein
MKLETWTALLLSIVPQFGWGQTNGASKLSEVETAAPLSHNTYSVIGATPRQETLLRAQIQVMNAEILPLRIVFVPHWKYLDTARTFHLHVPTGYTSAMFTHLPSRTVFIDADRYIKDDSLVYWMAHELGHLATNSTKEGNAEKAAGPFRARLKESANPVISATRASILRR